MILQVSAKELGAVYASVGEVGFDPAKALAAAIALEELAARLRAFSNAEPTKDGK